jgi:hypothetical protein
MGNLSKRKVRIIEICPKPRRKPAPPPWAPEKPPPCPSPELSSIPGEVHILNLGVRKIRVLPPFKDVVQSLLETPPEPKK